jgi:hypothetical protein
MTRLQDRTQFAEAILLSTGRRQGCVKPAKPWGIGKKSSVRVARSVLEFRFIE